LRTILLALERQIAVGFVDLLQKRVVHRCAPLEVKVGRSICTLHDNQAVNAA